MKKIGIISVTVGVLIILSLIILLVVMNLPTRTKMSSTNQNTNQTPQKNTNRTFIISLEELNKSGQTGTATFTEMSGGKTAVKVFLSKPNSATPQSVAIYEGSCKKMGKQLHSLSTASSAYSDTVLNISIDALLTSGEQSVYLYEKVPSASTACGTIPTPN